MLIVAVVMSDRWAQTRCNEASLEATQMFRPHSASLVLQIFLTMSQGTDPRINPTSAEEIRIGLEQRRLAAEHNDVVQKELDQLLGLYSNTATVMAETLTSDASGRWIFVPCRAQIHRSLRSRPRRWSCLLYTSPSPRDGLLSRMPSSA